MPIASINPVDGTTIKTFDPLTETQIDEKLQRAADIFRSYRHTPFAERESLMMRAAEILETEKHDFARLMTTEMGKPIKGAVGEIEKCAMVCRYYAENARHHLADELVETNAKRSYIRFQPLNKPFGANIKLRSQMPQHLAAAFGIFVNFSSNHWSTVRLSYPPLMIPGSLAVAGLRNLNYSESACSMGCWIIP